MWARVSMGVGCHFLLRAGGPPSAARRPDALVRLTPHPRGALRLRLDDRPQTARQSLASPRVQQDGAQHGAEDVVLALIERTVADAHRPRAGVAGEVVAC